MPRTCHTNERRGMLAMAALRGQHERPHLAPAHLQHQIADGLAVEVGARVGSARGHEDGHGQQEAHARRVETPRAAQQRPDARADLELVEQVRERTEDPLGPNLGRAAVEDAAHDAAQRRARVGHDAVRGGGVAKVVDLELAHLRADAACTRVRIRRWPRARRVAHVHEELSCARRADDRSRAPETRAASCSRAAPSTARQWRSR